MLSSSSSHLNVTEYISRLVLFLGLTKLEARSICRNFERRDLVISVMKDQGRQRTTHFVAKKFAHLCHVRSTFIQ